ncbi:MAG: hypothetical protein R3C19_07570 [Planctomycetaceae bacterium]
MSSSSNRFSQPDDDEQVALPEEHDESAEEADSKVRRMQKLANIRAAIDAGLFDSDEVLEEAMRRLVKRIQSGAEGE